MLRPLPLIMLNPPQLTPRFSTHLRLLLRGEIEKCRCCCGYSVYDMNDTVYIFIKMQHLSLSYTHLDNTVQARSENFLRNIILEQKQPCLDHHY